MNEEERRKIISEDYVDGIVEYAISTEEFVRYAGTTINYINNKNQRLYLDASRGYN